MTDKLTAERLAAIADLAEASASVRIDSAVAFDLVAAARERDEMAAILAKVRRMAVGFGFQPHAGEWVDDERFVVLLVSDAERAAAAEKERDELRNRVAELEYAVRHPDDPAYAKGREDERREVVAWLHEPTRDHPDLSWYTAIGDEIKRGEHVK